MARRPVQKRAQQTRDRLMAALEQLLKEREFDQISIADIAKAAGVAVGSVYTYFRDKDAFLEALVEERLRTLRERIESPETRNMLLAASQLPGLREAMQAAAQSAYDQVMGDAHILRAILTYVRSNPGAEDVRNQLAEQAFQGVRALLAAFEDEITHSDPEAAALMINHFFNVIYLDRVVLARGQPASAVTVAPEALVRGVAEMAYGYLTLTPHTSIGAD